MGLGAIDRGDDAGTTHPPFFAADGVDRIIEVHLKSTAPLRATVRLGAFD